MTNNQQQNEAKALEKSLLEIDYSNAEISKVENEIYRALINSTDFKWRYNPIAPLAQPVNLTELVGGLFDDVNKQLEYQASRLDYSYERINGSNNYIKSSLENLEKNVAEASDAVGSLSTVKNTNPDNYLWVIDSFNSNVFIDLKKSTAITDTDVGEVTLEPLKVQTINQYNLSIDTEATNGIPGCNIAVIDKNVTSSSTQEPEPLFDSNNSKDFKNLDDNDSATWFEVERNFIAPKQNLTRQGRSYIFSSAGQSQDVLTVTNNYDWKLNIQWPGKTDTGSDGKGKSYAEFIDLEGKFNRISDSQNYNTNLVFDLDFLEPTSISFIKLNTLVRFESPVKIDFIQGLLENNQWVDIIRQVDSSSKSGTSALSSTIFKRTGTNSTGTIVDIPTDQNLLKLRFSLSSPAVVIPNGLAHPYKENLTSWRTERRYVLFSSVDRGERWGRVPFNENVPTVKSEVSTPRILGTNTDSIYATLKTTSSLANAGASLLGSQANKLNDKALTQESQGNTNSYKTAQTAQSISKTASSLGKIGAQIGKVAGVIGTVLEVVELAQQLFNVDHTETIKEVKTGYDIFKGWRSGVAIRDVVLSKVYYNSESVVVSVKRQFSKPVTKVKLFVEEYIPSSWGQSNWLTYYISKDGSNWVSLSSGDASDYTSDTSFQDIYFKAIIKGNPNDPYRSPRLLHYALQGS